MGSHDAQGVRLYGLTEAVEAAYERQGIKTLFAWQREVLDSPGVLDGSRNMIYTADTSAGKTLVAEIVVLKRLVEGSIDSKALFVLPFKALVAQKTAYFEKLLDGSSLNVKPYFGGNGELPMPRRLNLAVCTIEKANLVVQSLAEQGRLSELVCIVIDEAHMIGDDGRGAVLEWLLVKLLLHGRRAHAYWKQQVENKADSSTTQGSPPRTAQLVAMSATLPNTKSLALWWGNTHVHEVSFRPTPLLQRIVTMDGTTLDSNGKLAEQPLVSQAQLETVTAQARPAQGMMEARKAPMMRLLAMLSVPVLEQGLGVLIFCSSKAECVTTARTLASSNTIPIDAAIAQEIVSELEMASSDGADKALIEAIKGGVAWHHAGLSDSERKVIERAYELRKLKLLTATTSLGAGVNLPVFRVVIKEPRMGRDKLSAIQFKQAAALIARRTPFVCINVYVGCAQMAGRAGRAGLEVSGEAVAIAGNGREVQEIVALMNAAMPPVKSALMPPMAPCSMDILSESTSNSAANAWGVGSGQRKGLLPSDGLAMLLLETVALGLVRHGEDVKLLLRSSLWALQQDDATAVALEAQNALRNLCNHDLIRWQASSASSGAHGSAEWIASPLGRATALASSTVQRPSMNRGRYTYEQLDQVRSSGLCMLNDLHVIYLMVGEDVAQRESLWPNPVERMIKIVWPRGALNNGGQGGTSEASHAAAVAKLIGIEKDDVLTMRDCIGSLPPRRRENIRRLWIAMRLVATCDGQDVVDIERSYGKVDPGEVQAIQERVAFSGKELVRFCQHMQQAADASTAAGRVPGRGHSWWILQTAIDRVSERLLWSVKDELLGLVRAGLPSMTVTFAALLYRRGFRTIESLACASFDKIYTALKKGKGRGGNAKQLRAAARSLLDEARRDVAMQERERKHEALEQLQEAGLNVPASAPESKIDLQGLHDQMPMSKRPRLELTLRPHQRNDKETAQRGQNNEAEHRIDRAFPTNRYDSCAPSNTARAVGRSGISTPLPVSPANTLPKLQPWLKTFATEAPRRLVNEANSLSTILKQAPAARLNVPKPLNSCRTPMRKRQRSANSHETPWMRDSDMSLDSKSTGKDSDDQQRAPPYLPPRHCGPLQRINVVDDTGGAAVSNASQILLKDFAALWRQQSAFAFTLHVTGSHLPPQLTCHVKGISVCWEPPHVYYMALSSTRKTCAPGRGKDRQQTVCATLPATSNAQCQDAVHTNEAQGGEFHVRQLASSSGNVDSPALSNATRTPRREVSEIHELSSPANNRSPQEIPIHSRWRVLADVMAAEGIVKSVSDSKWQISTLLLRGVRVAGRIRDPQIAAHMLCPEDIENGERRVRSLRALASHYWVGYDHALIGMRGTARDLCCKCTLLCLHTMEALLDMLNRTGMLEVFDEQEMPLVHVLARMELSGIRVLASEMSAQRALMLRKTAALQSEGHRMVCRQFNWASPSDVAGVLFDQLRLDAGQGRDPQSSTSCKRKKNTHMATGKAMLEQLMKQHPLPAMILEHRQLSQAIVSTGIFNRFARPDWLVDNGDFVSQGNVGSDSSVAEQVIDTAQIKNHEGVIHCTFDQMRAATGRLVAIRPDLQCMQKPISFRAPVSYTSQSLHEELKDALLPIQVPARSQVRVRLASERDHFVHGWLVRIIDDTIHTPLQTPLNVKCADEVQIDSSSLHVSRKQQDNVILHDSTLADRSSCTFSIIKSEGNRPHDPDSRFSVFEHRSVQVLDAQDPWSRLHLTPSPDSSCSSKSGQPVPASRDTIEGTGLLQAISDSKQPCKLVWSVADYCRHYGFKYSEDRARCVQMVEVLVVHDGDELGARRPLLFPADQVWRVRTAIVDSHWPQLGPPPGVTLHEHGQHETVALRRAFVARAGCVLLSADYCQIELRMVAHLSGDEQLLQRTEEDIFVSMAAQLFSIERNNVDAKARDRAKKLCYAILYGVGPHGIMSPLGVDYEGAKQALNDWYRSYPGVQAYFQALKLECHKQGFVSTLAGRRRYLEKIRSTNRRERQLAERQAINSVCQGSAADVIKRAMKNIDQQLAAQSASRCAAVHSAKHGRLLLQIHDELIFEVEEAGAAALRQLVHDAMVNVGNLRVPLQVRLLQGKSWGDLHIVEQFASKVSAEGADIAAVDCPPTKIQFEGAVL